MEKTRKQAILNEIEVAKTDEERQKLIEELKRRPFNRLDLKPFRRWNQNNIIEAINKFMTSNGRFPTGKDFKHDVTLPTHVSVQKAFGINLKDYLDKFYPEYRKCNLHYNYSKSPNEWLVFFIHNYNVIKPTRSELYDALRPKDSPSWQSIAKICGVSLWGQLKVLARVADYDNKGNIKNEDKNKLEAVSHNDLAIDYLKLGNL